MVERIKIGLSKKDKPTIEFYDLDGNSKCKFKPTRIMLAGYTLELQKDLQVCHGMDIESEMLSILMKEMKGFNI